MRSLKSCVELIYVLQQVTLFVFVNGYTRCTPSPVLKEYVLYFHEINILFTNNILPTDPVSPPNRKSRLCYNTDSIIATVMTVADCRLLVFDSCYVVTTQAQ